MHVSIIDTDSVYAAIEYIDTGLVNATVEHQSKLRTVKNHGPGQVDTVVVAALGRVPSCHS